jgi:hypothetical protein
VNALYEKRERWRGKREREREREREKERERERRNYLGSVVDEPQRKTCPNIKDRCFKCTFVTLLNLSVAAFF